MKIILLQITAIAVLGLSGIHHFGSQYSASIQEPRVYQRQDTQTKSEQFFTPNDSITQKVDSIYNSLTDRQKAAQMIMFASSTSSKLGYPYSKALPLVKDGYVGNIVFLKGSMDEFREQVNEMNSLTSILSPMYACDCEPSLMNGKWSGTRTVAKANQQKTVTDVRKNTEILNKDMKSVGVQLNFAPVADNSVNQEVISNRAFGSNRKSIIELSNEFISFSQNDNIATSVKHFPGHGNVRGDSHKKLVFIEGELSELETFRSIIQSETPPYTVMVGHIAVRNNRSWGTNGLPATVSRRIVTDLLRNELKYNGIITTDAMNMLGVSSIPNADWKAVEAGVDLVLMPADPKSLNNKIVEALQKEDALSAQIQTSIKRIIRLKLILGII